MIRQNAAAVIMTAALLTSRPGEHRRKTGFLGRLRRRKAPRERAAAREDRQGEQEAASFIADLNGLTGPDPQWITPEKLTPEEAEEFRQGLEEALSRPWQPEAVPSAPETRPEPEPEQEMRPMGPVTTAMRIIEDDLGGYLREFPSYPE
jgi:hypothetical protein